MSAAKTLALALTALYAAAVFQPVNARDRNNYGVPDIMVEEGGKSVKTKKKGAEPKARPRSSSYVPSMTLPRSEPARVAPASPGVYTPPPINSFGDRATGAIHSYPLQQGIGNNPTNMQMYIRQNAN
jgi:hypothetical protein